MAIKIKNRNPFSPTAGKRRSLGDLNADILEVGRGEYCVMTIPHYDGPTVVHRFESKEEAAAQHQRNLEADQPLVGYKGLN